VNYVIIELTNIVAGLILAMSILPSIPAIGKSLAGLAKWLVRFQAVIGIIAIVLGVLNFGGLQGIVAIIAGLVLAMGILPGIVKKFSKWLSKFQTVIGIVAIIVGILGLF
jgi:membrane protein HdeD